MASRKQYTEAFKREAVGLAATPGNSIASVARDLGVNRILIGHWVRNAQAGKYEMAPGVPLKTEAQSEVEQLHRNLAKVKTERDKKVARLLREGPDVKYGFIAKRRAQWPVRVMCRVLEVSSQRVLQVERSRAVAPQRR